MKNSLIILLISFFTLKTSLFCQTQNPTKGKIHVFQSERNGFHAKTIFYDDGKEIVAFGALFEDRYAKQALEFLRKQSKNPIKWLVALDASSEQINGIEVFRKEGAKVIMSELSVKDLPSNHAFSKDYYINISKIFTNETYPKIPKADVVFDENYTLSLANGGKIILTELKQSAGSNNQTIAFIPSETALIVGDLINHNSHPWMEGPVVNGKNRFHTNNWIKALKTLEAKKFPPATIVYGAHGFEASLAEALPQQIAYLQKAKKTVSHYLSTLEGKTAKEKKAKVDYKLLTKLFLHTFPAYNWDYKITYGLYGMVEEVLDSMPSN
jgi:hypothetical protein